MEDFSTNAKDRILQFAEYKQVGREKFFQEIGVSYGNFKGKSKNSAPGGDVLARISTLYPDINLGWILTGKGDMLLDTDVPIAIARAASGNEKGIPLLNIEAMAGTAQGEFQILDNGGDRFVIPLFKGADYLIPVRGSSMYPKYNSGDIVACKRLALSDIFFQWNKVYVLDTDQGALIKRVLEGNDSEYIKLVSDNKDYPAFELHRERVNAVALVIGVIRLE